MRHFLLSLLAFIVFISYSVIAEATTVTTLVFSGSVTETVNLDLIPGYAEATVSVGDHFGGYFWYTYETTPTGSYFWNMNDNPGFYIGYSIYFNGFVLATYDSILYRAMGIYNGEYDSLGIVGIPVWVNDGISRRIIDMLSFTLFDSSGTAFSDGSFPSILNPSAFDSGRFVMSAPDYDYGGDKGWGIEISGSVDSVYAYSYPIPEPATILLIGSGLIGLAGFGRKKFLKK